MTALRQISAVMLESMGRRGFQAENLRGGEIDKYFGWEEELKCKIPLLQFSMDDGERHRRVVDRHGEYAFACQ